MAWTPVNPVRRCVHMKRRFAANDASTHSMAYTHTHTLTVSCSWKVCRQFSPWQMESYFFVKISENFRELFNSLTMCIASTIPCPLVSPPPVSTSSRSLQDRNIRVIMMVSPSPSYPSPLPLHPPWEIPVDIISQRLDLSQAVCLREVQVCG